MASSLPSEIWETIIDHLYSSKTALLQCSLVCKSWLPACRYHLFASVVLGPENLHGFQSLISSGSCTVRNCVQELFVSFLELSPAASDSPAEVTLADHLSTPKVLKSGHVPNQLRPFSKLTRVSAVILVNGDAFPVQDSTYAPQNVELGLAFAHVTRLRIDAFSFTSFHAFCDLISSFRHLETLHMMDLEWSEEPPEEAFVSGICPAVPKHLHEIHLSRCYSRDIIGWILSEFSVLITVAFLGIVSPSDVNAISRLLQRSGPHLRALQFSFESFDAGGDAEDFFNGVDLSLNTRLRFLQIDGFMLFHSRGASLTTPEHWVLKILSTLQSPSVEEIALEVASNVLCLDEEDLSAVVALDAILSEPKFGKLRTLRFPSNKTEQLQKLRGLMPCTKTKGIIANGSPVYASRIRSKAFDPLPDRDADWERLAAWSFTM